MGNDMRIYGGALRLADDTDEAALTKRALDTLTTDAEVRLHRFVTLDHLPRDPTLEALFGAFDLVPVRDGTGLVSCFGIDQRYCEPQTLLRAIAPGVAAGSWVALETDYDGLLVITFQAATATVTLRPGASLVQQWDWGMLIDADLPPSGDRNHDLTAMVSYVTGRFDMSPGLASPRLGTHDHDRFQEGHAAAQPWLV